VNHNRGDVAAMAMTTVSAAMPLLLLLQIFFYYNNNIEDYLTNTV
jgi:hypothetical protein